jgi:transposase-like protein
MKRLDPAFRKKALAMYLEGQGKTSLVKIAKTLGINRNTASQWRKEDGWDTALSETMQEIGKNVTKNFAGQLSEQIVKKCEHTMDNSVIFFDLIDKITFYKCFQFTPGGDRILDSNGRPTLNFELSAKDIKRLSDAHVEKIKAVRYVHDLVSGRSSSDLEYEDRLNALEQTVNQLKKVINVLHAHTDITPLLNKKKCEEQARAGEMGEGIEL